MKTKNPFPAGITRRHCPLALGFAGALAFAALGNAGHAQYSSSNSSSNETSQYSDTSRTYQRSGDATTSDQGSTMERGGTASESTKLDHKDKAFIEKAAKENAHEIGLSQLAAERATNADVKAFAEQMVRDHQQLASDIADLAARKGVSIDKEVQKGQEMDVKSLSKENGGDFDKKYVKKMVKGHKDTLELFQKAATDCKDPDVIALATKALPTITQHNEHAQQLGTQFNL